ncbi:hypothetical protein FGO68_gene2574 [Halteria grandinella]|uniref:Iron-binding zinc finger CDGSH type domain-containing protein n=1 Tax=Halteria grandinella TaxID=5974 RepID=A0A8J8T352_HALGN|nr:hypothetical protein FGO68_gene2574 [Halteria grandinella]
MESNPFKPYKVGLVQGETYSWCTCGQSATQPFCDNSHKDTHLKPMVFVHEQPTGNYLLCGCKNNKKESGAHCDGSHKNMQW